MAVMPRATIAAEVLDEAAEWLLRLHSGAATDADRRALQQWREAHPDHEQAWRRAEDFLYRVREVPAPIAHHTLQQPVSSDRRRVTRHLALLFAAAPLAWLAAERLPWRVWKAQYRTARGERRELRLEDGTILMLNTASAIDVRFDGEQRVVSLREGEVLVTTAQDAAQRPFFVETEFGSAQAIGTRFSVRQHADRSAVAVYEGIVELRPFDATPSVLRLVAGQQASFTRTSLSEVDLAHASATMWTRGMVVAEDWRLDELTAELDRYRSGRLRCDPAVADLRISGAFPLDDLPRSLELIEEVLPVQRASSLRYWTVIEPRGAGG